MHATRHACSVPDGARFGRRALLVLALVALFVAPPAAASIIEDYELEIEAAQELFEVGEFYYEKGGTFTATVDEADRIVVDEVLQDASMHILLCHEDDYDELQDEYLGPNGFKIKVRSYLAPACTLARCVRPGKGALWSCAC